MCRAYRRPSSGIHQRVGPEKSGLVLGSFISRIQRRGGIIGKARRPCHCWANARDEVSQSCLLKRAATGARGQKVTLSAKSATCHPAFDRQSSATSRNIKLLRTSVFWHS